MLVSPEVFENMFGFSLYDYAHKKEVLRNLKKMAKKGIEVTYELGCIHIWIKGSK